MDATPSDAPSPGSPPESLASLGRRERKKLETRSRILFAAFELFALKGFEATTIDEIADRADVGKGTVFNYFPQKTAFLSTAYQEWMAGMLEELGPVESWGGTLRTQLHRIARYMADLCAEYRDLARLVIFESMRQTHLQMGRGEAPSDEPARTLEALVAVLLQRGQDRGEIRNDVATDQAASLMAAAILHTLIRWLVRGGEKDQMQQALSGKLDIIFDGLAPEGKPVRKEGP